MNIKTNSLEKHVDYVNRSFREHVNFVDATTKQNKNYKKTNIFFCSYKIFAFIFSFI